MSELPNILAVVSCLGVWAEIGGPFTETIPVLGFGKMPKKDAGDAHAWRPLVYDGDDDALTTIDAYIAPRIEDLKRQGVVTEVSVRLVTKD